MVMLVPRDRQIDRTSGVQPSRTCPGGRDVNSLEDIERVVEKQRVNMTRGVTTVVLGKR